MAKNKRKAASPLAVLREREDLTQLEVSQLLGVTEHTYQNWERGRFGTQAIRRVIMLCKIFKCLPEELLQQTEKQ